MKNVSIVLTATIRPNVEFVARTDTEKRLEDYKKCVSFYLENTNYQVIFAENSGFELTAAPQFNAILKNDRFIWKSIEPHPDLTKGKGFQEFYILDKIIESQLLSEYMIKVTGRYLVRNINSLIPKMKMPMHIDLHRQMKVAITGCFGVQTDFYRDHFYGKYNLANDSEGRFIEHVVYDTIFDRKLLTSVNLLPENPMYEGVSGSHGNSMTRNPYKMKIRSLERTINRALGIKKFLIEY